MPNNALEATASAVAIESLVDVFMVGFNRAVLQLFH